MRSIDELRGKHAGQDIWIIGAGASMQYVDPALFAGKVTIGINLVNRRFPTTYTVIKDDNEFGREAAERAATLIVSEFAYADERRGRNNFENAYYFEHVPPGEPDEIDLSVIGTNKIIVTWSTLSSAMHLACEMGAANVILCGIDGGTLDGVINFPGYYDWLSERYWYLKFVRDVCRRTREVRDALQAHYGCRIYSLSPFLGLTTDGHDFRSAEATPRCRHCRSDHMTFLCDGDCRQARFFLCAECGCVSSDLKFRDVAEFYSQKDYADHHHVPREALLDAVRHNFRRIIRTLTPEKSCLDVGCLEGALLELLADDGWQTQGWDIAADGRPAGTIVGDAEFRAATIGRQFGLVISREVIEHVPDHRQHIRELAAAVMPGGFLHLQAPRPHDDLADKVTWQTTHLQILDPGAVRQLLTECGLIVEHVELWAQGQLWQARKPA